jgi:hypothetical protein
MKMLIKLEEAALFALGGWMFARAGLAWWWFPLLLLAPDLGMLGYLAGPGVGAATYNVAHHRALAVVVWLMGWWLAQPLLLAAGGILFAHASIDRVFGYGLKLAAGFKHTHLGVLK